MNLLSPNSAKKAICYHRHSAEDKQENSVPIQREHAEDLAKKAGVELIHEEADEGVSGLTDQRPGFQRLFKDWILNPNAPYFDYIFVYDVSRWGRFQNQNMAAYYEHLCERNGKKVIYVSRGFPKEGQDQSLTDSIITPIERFMAAQYSRQLSEKVWYGCVKISRDGFFAGGTPCYGMTRLLLDLNKKPIRILQKGEHKQISNERVTLTPCNDQTSQIVKDIYEMFVRQWRSTGEIADILNERGVPSAMGRKWSRPKVVRILTNETYTGALIYNRTWRRLKQKKARNPRNEWVITKNAFPAIVDEETFWQAQEIIFWLLPSRWRRGLSAVRKVQRTAEKEIKGILLAKGITEDNADRQLKDFPMIYSVNFKEEALLYRCFKIPERMRNYEKVFAVSVDLNKKDLIDTVFLIPTVDFNGSNFILFSESDPSYGEYNIGLEKVYELVKPWVEQVEEKKDVSVRSSTMIESGEVPA